MMRKWGAMFLCFVSLSVLAERPTVDEEDLYARIIIRSPDQLAAFYQGREFPKAAIDEILKVCMLTPIIKNRRYERMWIDLDMWQFEVNGKPVKRLTRDYWRERWERIGLDLRYRATFGWTLMPERRDLRLDEGVGGSVVIPWQKDPVSLKIVMPLGADGRGNQDNRELVFEGLSCSGN